MRILAMSIVAAIVAASSPAFADDPLVGKSYVTVAGQPFCSEISQLQEYIQAVLLNDKRWMGQLKDDCISVKAGLKVAVIEDEPSGSDVGHVVKTRIFVGDDSFVGYTLSVGLKPQP